MPLVQASYFLGNRLVAQTSLQTLPAQRSLMYICLTCGEVWARVLCLNDGVQGKWDPVCCPCERHHPIGVQDWRTVPGSLIISDFRACNESAYLRNLPESLLPRELTLHLANYERNQNA